MPVTKSAIKKLRQDKKRTVANNAIKKDYSDAVKSIKKSKGASPESTFSKIDKAVKKGLIHKNKAARLKSQISKTAPKKTGTTKSKPVIKKGPVKKPTKSAK